MKSKIFITVPVIFSHVPFCKDSNPNLSARFSNYVEIPCGDDRRGVENFSGLFYIRNLKEQHPGG
jgi:hypothetical protein